MNLVPERGGIVTVSGSIDSKVLMEVIRNNYKNAKLLCPFDQKKPSKYSVGKTCSCSGDVHDDDEDDDNHDFALKNRGKYASIGEPKKEKKNKKCGIMRFFGKKSNPTAMRPLPPRPPPGPRLPMGFPTNGFFPGPPRPGFLPGMSWMQPNGPPPPYGCLGGPPLPAGYVFPIPRSPPRSNPMVHYTSYMDNYRYPNY